jgi:hypothetical protein
MMIYSEVKKMNFYKFEQSSVVNEWITKKYELTNSLDILKGFIWLWMMGIDYNDEKGLKDEEKRYKVFISMLSKSGIDYEQLFEAGKEILQGNQIWNLNLKNDQFKIWSRLCKSMIPESQLGLSLLTNDEVESLNPWIQEEICYGAGMVLLKKFINVNTKKQFVDLKEEDIMVEIERLDLMHLIGKNWNIVKMKMIP